MNGIADTVTHEMKRCLAQHLEVIEQRFDNADSILKKIEDQNASIEKRLLNLETSVTKIEEEVAEHTTLFRKVHLELVALTNRASENEETAYALLSRFLLPPGF